MSTARRSIAMLVLVLTTAAMPAAAQSVDFGGQLRPRLDSRTDGRAGENLFSLRTRLSVLMRSEPGLRIFAEVQDLRATSGPLNAFDEYRSSDPEVHQLFVGFGDAAESFVRVGRQEVAFAGERLVGALDWAQRSRAFDGIRASLDVADGTTFNAFLLYDVQRVDRRDTTIRTVPRPLLRRRPFVGGHLSTTSSVADTLDLFFLRQHRNTVGSRLIGRQDGVTYRAELAFQFGRVSGFHTQAYMWAAEVGTHIGAGRGHISLGYDRLSGGSPTAAFSTLYATNHKYYGLADVFIDVPSDTGVRGLQDLAVKAHWRIGDAIRTGIELHHFRPSAGRELDSSTFGHEIDFTARYSPDGPISVLAGVSRVFAGGGLIEIGRLDGDLTIGYLMLDFRL